MKDEKMYNAEQKEAFLASAKLTPSMDSLFRNVFLLVAPYEEEKQADICTWGREECQSVLEKLAGFRSYSSDNRAKLLRRYASWCLAENVPGATDNLLSSRASGKSKVREMTVSGPEHLEKILNAVFDPVEMATSDIILRGYCWLAFSGLQDEEIAEVSAKEVDLDRFLISHNGAVFQLCTQAISTMRILREMSAFRYYHPGYDEDFIWRVRSDGDKLLRGIRGAKPNVLVLRSMLSTRVNEAYKSGKIDVKISCYRLWISGQFYRMFQKERMGEPVDFSDLASFGIRQKEEKGRPYKLSSENGGRTIAGKTNEISSSYREDYERWKRAYSV